MLISLYLASEICCDSFSFFALSFQNGNPVTCLGLFSGSLSDWIGKLENFNAYLHPCSDVGQMCLPHKIGGRGLKSVDVVCEEVCNLIHYFQGSDDQQIVEVKRVNLFPESKELKSAKFDKCLQRCLAKPLHGYYERVCSSEWD